MEFSEVLFLDGGDGPDGGEVADGVEIVGGRDHGAGGNGACEDDSGGGSADRNEVFDVGLRGGVVLVFFRAVEGDFEEFDEVEPGAIDFDLGIGDGGLGDLQLVLGGIELLLAGGLQGIEAGEAVALAGGEFDTGFEAVQIGDGDAIESARFVDVVAVHAGQDLALGDAVSDLGIGENDAAVGDGAHAPRGVLVRGEAAVGADGEGDAALHNGSDDEGDLFERSGIELDELGCVAGGLRLRLGRLRRGGRFGAGGQQEDSGGGQVFHG